MLVIVEVCLLVLKVDDNATGKNHVNSVSVEVDYTHCHVLNLLTRRASTS